jgi:hypothetical protein
MIGSDNFGGYISVARRSFPLLFTVFLLALKSFFGLSLLTVFVSEFFGRFLNLI